MRLYLITLLSILLFSCKKQAGKPEPDQQGTIKSLSTTRTKNSNGHQILTTYQYNSAGAPYLETSKDESTGLEIFQIIAINKEAFMHLTFTATKENLVKLSTPTRKKS